MRIGQTPTLTNLKEPKATSTDTDQNKGKGQEYIYRNPAFRVITPDWIAIHLEVALTAPSIAYIYPDLYVPFW